MPPTDVSVIDQFGRFIKLSADGSHLAILAQRSSDMPGINAPIKPSVQSSGAVFIYDLSQEKPNLMQAKYRFQNLYPRNGLYYGGMKYDFDGYDRTDFESNGIAFSQDAGLLVIGAMHEGSSASGINGNEAATGRTSAGAVWIYRIQGQKSD